MATGDTIAAIAAHGAIGIVRISGEAAVSVLRRLFSLKLEYEHRKIYYGRIIDGGEVIDECVVFVMYAPKSYTREDVVEIQCHGGNASLKGVLAAALRNGARAAEAGEFTKRAFLNGRLDLSQAEAVSSVISAKTDAARRLSVEALGGGFSRRIAELRARILGLVAGIEVSVDYPDEAIGEIDIGGLIAGISGCASEADALRRRAARGRCFIDGVNTVILGRPNVGKSSVLNALLREDRSIVSDIPGTTRDTVTEYVAVAGIPLKISDTAGIRESGDAIERMGVEKARKCAAAAELLLIIVDSSDGVTADDAALLEYARGRDALVLANKTDLGAPIPRARLEEFVNAENIIGVSAKNGDGFDEFESRVRGLLVGSENEGGEIAASLRQTELLDSAESSLKDALETLSNGLSVEFASLGLTEAYRALGEIIGEELSDDIADKIFSEFCVGK